MMEDFKVPASETQQRKEKVQKELQNNGIDGLFIVQRVDLLYFSGTSQDGFLYLPAEGEPLLFFKRYMSGVQEKSSIKNIVEIGSIEEVPDLITDFYGHTPRVLGFEFDVLPVRDFNFYRNLFSHQECVDGSPSILKVRMIKSDWEIAQMERIAELTRKTFEYMKSTIHPGLTEMEFAGMFEAFAGKLSHRVAKVRARDYQAEGYAWHVLSGKSGGMVGLLDSPASGEGTSAAFPCGAGSKRVAANEPIMIDFAFELNGYHMDETRMFAIGSMPDRAMKASKAAIEIHDAVLDKVKPGITVDQLFRHSVSKAESLGYAEPYLGPPGYKVTFIGHGIGLELIETPVLAKNKGDRLEPGMTFALEPKMVFRNEFAAGIESVFVVTETGYRLISKVPVEIFIC